MIWSCFWSKCWLRICRYENYSIIRILIKMSWVKSRESTRNLENNCLKVALSCSYHHSLWRAEALGCCFFFFHCPCTVAGFFMGYNSCFRPFKKFFSMSHVLQTQHNSLFVTICSGTIFFFFFFCMQCSVAYFLVQSSTGCTMRGCQGQKWIIFWLPF